MTEYHGWLVLYSGNSDWSDDDWRSARATALAAISPFIPADGHAIAFADTCNSMQTVYFHGYTDSSIAPIKQLFLTIADAVPESYGELSVVDESIQTFQTAERYQLSSQGLRRIS